MHARHETAVFETMDIRQQRTLIPEGQKINVISPVIAPAPAFTEFPSCGGGQGTRQTADHQSWDGLCKQRQFRE